MKTFLVACLVAIVVAVAGGVVLNNIQQPADKAFAMPDSVRLGA